MKMLVGEFGFEREHVLVFEREREIERAREKEVPDLHVYNSLANHEKDH